MLSRNDGQSLFVIEDKDPRDQRFCKLILCNVLPDEFQRFQPFCGIFSLMWNYRHFAPMSTINQLLRMLTFTLHFQSHKQ